MNQKINMLSRNLDIYNIYKLESVGQELKMVIVGRKDWGNGLRCGQANNWILLQTYYGTI